MIHTSSPPSLQHARSRVWSATEASTFSGSVAAPDEAPCPSWTRAGVESCEQAAVIAAETTNATVNSRFLMN